MDANLTKARKLPIPDKLSPPALKILKRDGSTQPFDRNKIATSMRNAGATEQQTTLVTNRVANRLGGFKQPIPSSQLSSMTARSLSKVNPVASSQYTSFRDQKLRNTPTTNKQDTQSLTKTSFISQSVPIKPTTYNMTRITGSPTPNSRPSLPTPVRTLAVDSGAVEYLIAVGQSAFLHAQARGGTPPYAYQWMEGAITVGTGEKLTFHRCVTGTRTFFCKAKDPSGSTGTSKNVTVTVKTPPSASQPSKPNQIVIRVLDPTTNNPRVGNKIQLRMTSGMFGSTGMESTTDNRGIAEFNDAWNIQWSVHSYEVWFFEVQGEEQLGIIYPSDLDNQHRGIFTYYCSLRFV